MTSVHFGVSSPVLTRQNRTPSFKPSFSASQLSASSGANSLSARPFSSLNASHTRALYAPGLRFGHALTKDDYVIAHSASVPIDSSTAAKTLQSQMNTLLFKLAEGDTSHLTYSIESIPDNGSSISGVTAMADNLTLLGHPVDTFIQSQASAPALLTLQNTRLNPNARFYMGKNAVITFSPGLRFMIGKNPDIQITREFLNEFQRDLETLLMHTTGETSREKIHEDLNSKQEYNALQALAYGKKGLTDAILVGKDKVLTREKLDEFYLSKGWTSKHEQKKMDDFNSDIHNLEEIPDTYLKPLNEFNAGSVAPEMLPVSNPRTSYHEVSMPKQFILFQRMLGNNQFSIIPSKPFKKEFIDANLSPVAQNQRWMGTPLPGILFDDVIHMSSCFTDFSAKQVIQALEALDEKKSALKEAGLEPSNLKLLVNSPGGHLHALEAIRHTIAYQETPVDVIVQGFAASCGGFLLASATGNKFATPNSRILLHPSTSGHYSALEHMNQELDSLHVVNQKLVDIVSHATGRPAKEVSKDFNRDFWMNPTEAMFYGPKGLVDGILVGADKVITKDQVMDYLTHDEETQAWLKNKYGHEQGEDNVKAYLDDHINSLREANRVYKPAEWKEKYGQDPLSNPMETILKLTPKAQSLDKVEHLKQSVTKPQVTVDHFPVTLDDDELGALIPYLKAGKAEQKGFQDGKNGSIETASHS